MNKHMIQFDVHGEAFYLNKCGMHAAHKSLVKSTPASRSVAMPWHYLQPSYTMPYSVFTKYCSVSKYCIIKIIHCV